MSTNTYIDPVLTTELREWIQNDTFEYEDVGYDVYIPPWNKGLHGVQDQSYRIGVPRSAETKRRISENNVGMRGKKHKPETIEKMRAPKSEEWKKNISKAMKKMYQKRKKNANI